MVRSKECRGYLVKVVTVIFKEILWEMVECYVDDLVAKLRRSINHLEHLKAVIQQTSSALTKVNPMKCGFKIAS